MKKDLKLSAGMPRGGGKVADLALEKGGGRARAIACLALCGWGKGGHGERGSDSAVTCGGLLLVTRHLALGRPRTDESSRELSYVLAYWI